jgi:hypothetical protein
MIVSVAIACLSRLLLLIVPIANLLVKYPHYIVAIVLRITLRVFAGGISPLCAIVVEALCAGHQLTIALDETSVLKSLWELFAL